MQDKNKSHHNKKLTSYMRLNNMEVAQQSEHAKRFFNHKPYEHIQEITNAVGSNKRNDNKEI